MLTSPIDEIKNRLDIVDVVGQYIKLQKAGVNYRAICPFHSEKKPSFFVSPSRQIWHCFGCAAGGGLFDFVMKIEGIEFGDALRILAQKAGVELKPQDPKLQTERKRLYDILELSAKFFEKQLSESRVGQEAKQYLLKRGLTEESIKKWRIGYAPDSWQGLSDFLVGQGYGREEIVKAGLAIKKEEEGENFKLQAPGFKFFDRFRGRIMFPIFDIQGQVVGFGGRIFKTEDTAKYVNTPNTLLYDKSRILYGLDKAKLEIRKKDSCVLVEGYMDAIMLCQAGYENVVATSGTALTPYQLKVLKRYSENILTAFDMDIAGDSATKRGIDLAQSYGFNVKVVVMPQGKDPADIAAENPEIFGHLMSQARSIMDFYFESTLAKFDRSTVEGKKQISKILLPVIKRIPNAIEQAHWRQKLAQLLQVKEEDVEKEIQKVPAQNFNYFEENEEGSSEIKMQNRIKPRREILEEYIISLVLKYQHKVELIPDNHLHLFSEETKKIIEAIKKRGQVMFAPLGSAPLETEHGNLTGFAVSPASSEGVEEQQLLLPPRLVHLLLLAESGENWDDETIDQELTFALGELHRLEMKRRLEEVSLAIKEAETSNDIEKTQTLVREFHELSRELES